MDNNNDDTVTATRLRLDIFEAHGIADIDVEPPLMHRIFSEPSFNTRENLERVARFTKVNKGLKQDGQEPLSLVTTTATNNNNTTEAEKTQRPSSSLCVPHLLENRLEAVSIPPYVLASYSTYNAHDHHHTDRTLKRGFAPSSLKFKAKEVSDSLRLQLWRQIETWVENVDKSELESAAKNQFSIYEYVCIRGTYGGFLSLNLDEAAYTYTHKKSRSIIHMKKNKKDPNSVPYLRRKLLLLAKRRLRFPEQIPALKVQFSDIVTFIEASNRQPLENS